jgi:hypothetical protein
VRENIVCMAKSLHDDYHGGRGDARESLARHVLRNRPDTQRYIERMLGGEGALGAWLERHGVMDAQVPKVPTRP